MTLAIWPAHKDWANVVEPSQDGQQIVSSARDGVVRIWDADRGGPVWSVQAYTKGHWVLGAALSPDSREVATSGDDGVVAIWDVESRERRIVARLGQQDATSAAFSPDGQRLILPLLTGTVRVVPLSGDGRVVNLRGHTG